MEDRVVIDPELCTGCGVCAVMCPRQILEVDADTGVCTITDQSRCDMLGGCEFQCPTGAITVRRPAISK